MALPTMPQSSDSWFRKLGLPSNLTEMGSKDTELYEEEDRFVLDVEMPGFNAEDIQVTWNDGRLNIAAEKFEEKRDRKRTYHRKFRLPKEVIEEQIEAKYENGILEVIIPIEEGSSLRGREIPVHG